MYGRSFSSCSDSCMGRKHGTLWKKLTDMKLPCLGKGKHEMEQNMLVCEIKGKNAQKNKGKEENMFAK